MLKKILCILPLAIIVLNLTLSAEPVNPDIARKVAITHLKVKDNSQMYSLSEIEKLKNDDKIVAYVVHLKPKGFIAISTDTDIIPIIAYSFRSNFLMSDTDENILYQMVKNDMDLRLQAIPELSTTVKEENNILWDKYVNEDLGYFASKDFQQWPEPGSTMTGGWIETTWNQGAPFNLFCPLDPNTGQRCVVGCVATAMAQIINFHKYIGEVSFDDSDSYITNGIHIDSDSTLYDFPSFNQLNVYLDTLGSHYQHSVYLDNDDLAALNFACGISVHMSYSSSGSGAWTQQVANALLQKFSYDSALWMLSGHQQFYDSLSANMMNIKPAELTIYQPGNTGGHAIVCDGYNTDDEYHLNFGWGSTQPDPINTAWYSLPQGMPAGYTIVNGAVLNIEGGEKPVDVYGNVYIDATDPIGTEITFTGDYIYNVIVDNSDGDYQILNVMPGHYTATALLNNKLFYCSKEVDIDSTNYIVNFNMINYDKVSGVVSIEDGISPIGTYISLEGDYNYATTVMDSNGYYEIPDVMPGHYTATASLNKLYFQSKEVDIDSMNMEVNFYLGCYEGGICIHYDDEPTDVLDIGQEYTVEIAVRFTLEELNKYAVDGDLIGQIKFWLPISPDSAEVTARVWEGGSPENPPGELVYESVIDSFIPNQWTIHKLNRPVQIKQDTEYWIGYKIHTINGIVASMDSGPMEPEKGAWLKNTAWILMPTSSCNYNWNIRPIIATSVFGTMEGNVTLNGGSGQVEDVRVVADDVATHPDSSGNYSVQLKPGNYDVTASLEGYEPATIQNISIEDGMITSGIDFILVYDTPVDDNTGILLKYFLNQNYPNPFNPMTVISFSIPKEADVELKIYNIKGELVKTLVNERKSAGSYDVIWNGRNDNGNEVSSGIYFYKMITDDYSLCKKMLLIK